MARKYEITNLRSGPFGFHEVGKAKPTMLGRGQTEVLTLEGGIEKLALSMAEKREIELADLGPVEPLDHDGDGRKGGTAPAAPAPGGTTEPAPKPEPTLAERQAAYDKAVADGSETLATDFPDGRPEAGYEPSLDFETLDEDALRAFLKTAEVQFHPATGKPKLVAKALEADRAAWDEQKAAAKKAGGSGEPI